MYLYDGKRLEILLGMENPFDYTLFKKLCEEQGIQAMPLMEFVHKVGALKTGLTMYPNLQPRDAYLSVMNPVQDIPSRGLGDTIAKITKATGLDQLATLYTKITGQPCGCASRQEVLNKLIPYNIKEEE
jgi:hypothetical protein